MNYGMFEISTNNTALDRTVTQRTMFIDCRISTKKVSNDIHFFTSYQCPCKRLLHYYGLFIYAFMFCDTILRNK